jgi:geranylgeranyl diphosphate synthase type II
MPFDLPGFEIRLDEMLTKLLVRGDFKTPPNLAESIRYSLLGPGKRFRPRLVMAAAEALSLKPEAAECAAFAIEMIHCFTLIHDDLPCMDNDDFRRGRPANHKQFGEAMALLAGDSLIGLGFEALMRARVHGLPAERVLAAVARLAAATGPRGVCGGQAAESLLQASSELPELERMHRAKTGALFAACLILPRELAGITEGSPLGVALEGFAFDFGLAFQIWDDLEDSLQDEEVDFNKSGTYASILHYMSFAEAKAKGLGLLERATERLVAALGDRADPLTQISDELYKKIEGLAHA